MILEPGDKILVAHRRLFEGDHARFFVGEVEEHELGVVRVHGWTWIRDGYQGLFTRKDDLRTKILSLSSGTLIVYALPESADLASLRLENPGGELFLCDDLGLRMDLSEGVLHGGGYAAGAQ